MKAAAPVLVSLYCGLLSEEAIDAASGILQIGGGCGCGDCGCWIGWSRGVAAE
jgi:hypothetical protein